MKPRFENSSIDCCLSLSTSLNILLQDTNSSIYMLLLMVSTTASYQCLYIIEYPFSLPSRVIDN